MCGINGFNFIDEKLISRMNEKTKHRGPDDTGVSFSSYWSLGHNRLSIIDLSPLGHQPMFTEDKKLSIVFNGEIYNFEEIKHELIGLGYKFVSKTDTEVILNSYREWGEKCLLKFNGMFAFAILNQEKEEMFIARDRVGIKPLYYYQKGNKFIFSSEIKAILEHDIPRKIREDALNMYFRMLYIPAPVTIFEDIYKLEPGHYAIVRKEGLITKKRYWTYEDAPLVTNKTEVKKEIHRLLSDSVKLELISDRPVGVFLSGGIDSTIIAGLASDYSKHIQTFSVGFPEGEESDKYNNDMHIARKTAKYFGTDHNEYILKAEDVIDAISESIYHMDEPISNHVQAANMLLAKEVSKKATVVLGGDGGDELFGGYERYYYSALIDQFGRLPEFVKKAIMFSFSGKPDAILKLKTIPGVQRYMNFFAQKEDLVASFLKKNNKNITSETFHELYFKNGQSKNFTRQFMRTDVLSWLPSESLVRSDKMSMTAGIEQRVPFLDHRLVEFADRIPIEYKLGSKGLNIFSVGRHYKGKIILKEAMKDYLPDFVLEQPKWGWFSPASKWIRGPLLPLMKEVLSPEYNAGTKDMFDFPVLNKILDDHISKKCYALNTLWSVMTFQIWYRQFMNEKLE